MSKLSKMAYHLVVHDMSKVLRLDEFVTVPKKLAMGSPVGGIPYPSMPYVQPLIGFALARRLSESPSSPVSIPVPPPDGKQLDPTDWTVTGLCFTLLWW
jgi:hypothetical protein